MPRKRCCGLVDVEVICQKFIPLTQPNSEDIVLQLEEFEALRLKDVKGLEQAECAALMQLSRPTFQRILQAARYKVATALVEGRAIIIKGGNYIAKNRVFECMDCQHVWEEEPCTEGGKHGREISCPKCGSMHKSKIENNVKHVCGGGHSPEEQGPGRGCCCGH